MIGKFQIRLKRKNIPEDDLLRDIKRVGSELQKKTITVSEYIEKGNFGSNTILRKFGSWNEALVKAGFEAPNRQNIPDEELFENIVQVWTRIGRQPFGRDLNKSNGLSSISLATYEKRFGSWNNALMAFDSFINTEERKYENNLKNRAVGQNNRRTERKINWRQRAIVLIRDNCICKMCGNSPAKDSSILLHVDHVIPWSKGGETVLENLQTLCQKCNIGKSDVYEENLEMEDEEI